MGARRKPESSAPAAAAIRRDLYRQRHAAQASVLRRFFKTGPGEYGAGDEFWGLKVPQVRKVLAQHGAIPLPTLAELLDSPIHELRFFAAAALARDYARAPASGRTEIFDFYLAHTAGINNWDLTFFKNIPVKEKLAFQFRWEMYNAFNHTQYNGVNTTAQFDAKGAMVNTAFGQISSARDPRIQQMSLRVTF